MSQLSSGHVFMSYSRRDDIVMRRIVAFLRKKGIKVWVDNEKLIPGTPIWEEEIEKAIKGASAIVVILSPDSKNSEWVRREISLADQYRRRVFPVLVSGDAETSITLRLINRQFVDIRKNEAMGLDSLETAISAYLQESIEQEENKEVTSKKITGTETLNLEADHTATLQIDNIGILKATLGWALAGLISGYMYSEYDMIIGGIVGGSIGGAIGGGLTTSLTLQVNNMLFDRKSMLRNILAWAIAGTIGWAIGWGLLSEASGAGIGMAAFAIIGLAGTLGMDYVLSNWKSTAVITLAWAIGGAIGWIISRPVLIDGLYVDKAISWAIGTAIGWAIGGFVMSRQLTRK